MDSSSTMAADTDNGNSTTALEGHHQLNGDSDFTLEQLERELPFVANDQVFFGELLSRVMQTIYAELSELAETCAAHSWLPTHQSTESPVQNAKHVR